MGSKPSKVAAAPAAEPDAQAPAAQQPIPGEEMHAASSTRSPDLGEISTNVPAAAAPAPCPASPAAELPDPSGGDFGFLAALAGGKSGSETPPGFREKQSSFHVGGADPPQQRRASQKRAQAAAPAAASSGAGGGVDGWATDMGGRKENQDTLFSLKIRSNGQRLWAGAVFDGHGREGKAAAEYARDRVQQVVEEQAATLLQVRRQPRRPPPVAVAVEGHCKPLTVAAHPCRPAG